MCSIIAGAKSGLLAFSGAFCAGALSGDASVRQTRAPKKKIFEVLIAVDAREIRERQCMIYVLRRVNWNSKCGYENPIQMHNGIYRNQRGRASSRRWKSRTRSASKYIRA